MVRKAPPTRFLVQAAFLAVVVAGVFLVRGHAERWCPLGGVEGLWPLLAGWGLPCSLAFTNLFILGGVVLSALLLKRAFCGYACPIGALSEWVRRGAARLEMPAVRVPRRLDAALSLLKYPALAAILWFTWRAGELIFRGFDPCYALISRHGEDITLAAYLVSGAVLAASAFVSVPFCRWLCPLAAVLNPFSRASPARIARDEAACTACGACARACPMAIPVDEVAAVTHARCTACLDCADACRVGAGPVLALRVAPAARRLRTRAAVIGGLLVVLAASVLAGVAFPAPPYRFARGEGATASVDLPVTGLTCRGRADLLVWFLTRDDDLSLEGALSVEAWPAPGRGRAVVRFDPARADADAVRRAVTEPYFVERESRWLTPPFSIEGHDPLGVVR